MLRSQRLARTRRTTSQLACRPGGNSMGLNAGSWEVGQSSDRHNITTSVSNLGELQQRTTRNYSGQPAGRQHRETSAGNIFWFAIFEVKWGTKLARPQYCCWYEHYKKNMVEEPEENLKRAGQEQTRRSLVHNSRICSHDELAAFQVDIMCGDFNQLTYRPWNKQQSPSAVRAHSHSCAADSHKQSGSLLPRKGNAWLVSKLKRVKLEPRFGLEKS
eukprot:6169800-Amphidinium_carterae.2